MSSWGLLEWWFFSSPGAKNQQFLLAWKLLGKFSLDCLLERTLGTDVLRLFELHLLGSRWGPFLIGRSTTKRLQNLRGFNIFPRFDQKSCTHDFQQFLFLTQSCHFEPKATVKPSTYERSGDRFLVGNQGTGSLVMQSMFIKSEICGELFMCSVFSFATSPRGFCHELTRKSTNPQGLVDKKIHEPLGRIRPTTATPPPEFSNGWGHLSVAVLPRLFIYAFFLNIQSQIWWRVCRVRIRHLIWEQTMSRSGENGWRRKKAWVHSKKSNKKHTKSSEGREHKWSK